MPAINNPMYIRPRPSKTVYITTRAFKDTYVSTDVSSLPYTYIMTKTPFPGFNANPNGENIVYSNWLNEYQQGVVQIAVPAGSVVQGLYSYDAFYQSWTNITNRILEGPAANGNITVVKEQGTIQIYGETMEVYSYYDLDGDGEANLSQVAFSIKL